MKKPVAIILVVIVLLAAGVGGWLWYQSHQDKGLTLYGNVDIRAVNMSFRVGGRLASLNVDEGDAIKSGQTLWDAGTAPYETCAAAGQKAATSVAQAQYDLMLAGYRDEEIAQAAAAVKQYRYRATTCVQNFYARAGAGGKPHHFQMIRKCALLHDQQATLKSRRIN